MLACSQDLFFHTDSNPMDTNFQKGLHDSSIINMQSLSDCQHKDKRMRLHQSKDNVMTNKEIDMAVNEMSNMVTNSLKDKEEQVWPPDVESAFIEALESIPKLGRRKILVNGKPCGRNELISDFIFRKTSKIRTRKQVSSHIQVLKNTRKGDAHFMRLLTDSVDTDDNGNITNRNSTGTNMNSNSIKTKNKQHHPYHRPHFPNHLHRHHGPKPSSVNNGAVKMKTYHSLDSLSSDDSSINSSPSPTDYMLDMMYGDPAQQQIFNMLQFKDFYDPLEQPIFSGTNTSALNLLDNPLMTDPFFGSSASATQTDLITPLLNDMNDDSLDTNLLNDSTPYDDGLTEELLLSGLDLLTKRKYPSSRKATKKSKAVPSRFSLWPNYLCLYLEYTLPYDPCRAVSHNLSQLPHCHATNLSKVPSSALPKEKCPPILGFSQSSKHAPLLLAKTKLDLNLNISNFSFNNTSFFESQTRRTIECTTTIYSFGNVVLESKEIQQALWVSEGKYMYNFVFVNQFFDAFLKGIRSLKSWDEVNIAVNNLCIVQSFEDIETKHIKTENETTQMPMPLLVMVYEFERGNGTVEVSMVEDSDVSLLGLDIENQLNFLDENL